MSDRVHFIYKTTNKINNRYYLGMHSTDDVDDGYLGSGLLITRSIKKYGVDNHLREILAFAKDRDELVKLEESIVTESLLTDNLCMNLRLGGQGGWDYINKSGIGGFGGHNHSDEAKKRIRVAASLRTQSEVTRKKISDRNVISNKSRGINVSKSLTGKPKTQEHRDNIAKSVKARYELKRNNMRP